jgi:hypothetical protein
MPLEKGNHRQTWRFVATGGVALPAVIAHQDLRRDRQALHFEEEP